MLYWLDLLGVAVFAVSGVLAAEHAGTAFFAGLATVVALRLGGIYRGWNLPSIGSLA